MNKNLEYRNLVEMPTLPYRNEGMDYASEVYNDIASEFGAKALASSYTKKTMGIKKAQYLSTKYDMEKARIIASRYNKWLNMVW